jgi:hypothetical protein
MAALLRHEVQSQVLLRQSVQAKPKGFLGERLKNAIVQKYLCADAQHEPSLRAVARDFTVSRMSVFRAVTDAGAHGFLSESSLFTDFHWKMQGVVPSAVPGCAPGSGAVSGVKRGRPSGLTDDIVAFLTKTLQVTASMALALHGCIGVVLTHYFSHML